MAWMFSKAENLLNTLDQSASQVLTSTPTQDRKSHANGGTAVRHNDFSIGSGGSNGQTPSSPNQMSTSASAYNLTPTDLANTASIRRTPSESTLGSPVAQKSRGSKLRTDQDDEKLFEFLNKPSTGTTGRSSPLAGERRKDKKNAVGSSNVSGSAINGRHSRQSSTSSTVSSKSARVDGVAMDQLPSTTLDHPGRQNPWNLFSTSAYTRIINVVGYPLSNYTLCKFSISFETADFITGWREPITQNCYHRIVNLIVGQYLWTEFSFSLMPVQLNIFSGKGMDVYNASNEIPFENPSGLPSVCLSKSYLISGFQRWS